MTAWSSDKYRSIVVVHVQIKAYRVLRIHQEPDRYKYPLYEYGGCITAGVGLEKKVHQHWRGSGFPDGK